MSLENVRFIIDSAEEFQEPPSLAASAEKPPNRFLLASSMTT
jgi:hypothetical protein